MKTYLKLLPVLLFNFLLISSINAQTTPSGSISYSNKSNIVIENKSFSAVSGNSASIYLNSCSNVIIRNCSFINIPSEIGVQLLNCSNIEITNCTFEKFRSGVYAQSSTGINVHCNSFKTIVGPKPRGQIVQFNACKGSGNRVNYNILEHELGTGDPEDLINMYASSGTSNDPIQIIGNHLRGGGPSASGGGIMVGDNDGHDIRIEDNILVNPGQYGIGCPAGYNITIKNNKVYGKQQSFTNVGIYVGLQSEIDAGFPCTASTIRVENNQVNWFRKDGVKNGFWNCSCCAGIISSGNNWNASITETILPRTLTLNSTQCSSSPVRFEITTIQLLNASNESLVKAYENLIGKSIVDKTNMNITNFNIYAQTKDAVDSVVFVHTYDGATTRRKEGVSPYALRGDGAGYITWNLPLGDHLLDVTAYKGGVSSTTTKLSFKVINESVTAIETFGLDHSIELYPNPVSNLLHLSYSTKWEILSMDGVVLEKGLGDIVDLAIFTQGVYLIRIENMNFKIVKD